MQIVMDKGSLQAFLIEHFPQVGPDFAIDAVTDDGIRMRLLTDDKHLRPGGTVSGPSMFALADVAVYAMVLARIGRQALAPPIVRWISCVNPPPTAMSRR